MKDTEVRELLEAIEQGHMYWSVRGMVGRYRFHLCEQVTYTSPDLVWDGISLPGTTYPMRPGQAIVDGVEITERMGPLAERFYHRDGWEQGDESGKVSLAYDGLKLLGELRGDKRKSVWA